MVRVLADLDLHLAVCAWTVLSALVLLSFQPHQEPRFLIPLVFPTILLVANSSIIDRLGKLFWVSLLNIRVVREVRNDFSHRFRQHYATSC